MLAGFCLSHILKPPSHWCDYAMVEHPCIGALRLEIYPIHTWFTGLQVVEKVILPSVGPGMILVQC